MTEIREAPRQLLWLVCEMRADWTREETWNAIHAARTAGRDWRGIVTRLVGIALRDETPPTRPRELWDDVRGIRTPAVTRTRLDPEVKAELFAELQAVTEAHRHGTTGPQPRLTEDAERELLRGPDP